ncbi:FAD-dependent oxidoreductase [Thermanaerosceptrum fracticalcis]|jgi:electron transfer flavoprotein-quinone oxidoreductase|uniref:FAD-dependent oxidoreductase n=1 Tax=Thermanaerosceptrum fracticalcis TaxID=1712410 RepID=A0A7G6E3T4_THEFR|nr:FAD-dependent oxidoreductase [Thermanaerosceptrum fracticalcis]QNB46738.1 FAD-dependent oxidoreductase [Thermanaerosceptrum fracticalcis]
MTEERFDCIVVGAGVAGSIAAYTLAQAGAEVLLIDRGNSAGAKNMTGGRLYAHSLEYIIPDFWEEAPVERRVVREIVSFVTPDSLVSVDFKTSKYTPETPHSFTILRAEFDRWVAEKAESAGAMVASGVRVDNLVVRDGKIVGVVADGDEFYADLVIAADGVNSLLAQKAGLRKELATHEVAVGVKEVIELPEGAIEERFGLQNGEGLAQLFVGDCTRGLQGGGFLYTNKNTLSLGLVFGLEGLKDTHLKVADLIEEFRNHPHIQPLVTGGRIVEYSAHLIPEAGLKMMPPLVEDGLLLVGDAAGFVINTGYMVRGMDLAIQSGYLAAQAVLKAKKAGNFGKDNLKKQYEEKIKESFIYKDLSTFKKAHSFMENPRLYSAYPELMEEIMYKVFTVTTTPQKPLREKLMGVVRGKVPLTKLIADAWKGATSL